MALSFSGYLAEADDQKIIAEAFNSNPYELTFGKKSAGDIFFTFHDEDDKEFRIQFYTPQGLGKNVRQVFIGTKKGASYLDSQQKFKNPMRVAATMIQATKDFLDTPIGKGIDGFAINFSKKVMDRGIALLPKIIRQSGLKQKLNVMDLKYSPDDSRGYVWVVRKGKDPAVVFDGPKMKGITWDDPEKVGDVPVDQPLASDVNPDWNISMKANYKSIESTAVKVQGDNVSFTSNDLTLTVRDGALAKSAQNQKIAQIFVYEKDYVGRGSVDRRGANWELKDGNRLIAALEFGVGANAPEETPEETPAVLTTDRWRALQNAVFKVKGLTGNTTSLMAAGSVYVKNKGKVFVSINKGVRMSDDPVTLTIKAQDSDEQLLNPPLIIRVIDITKPAALTKLIQQHVDDLVNLIDKKVPDSSKLDSKAILKNLQATSVSHRDLDWHFRENAGNIFVDWDITFRRNTREGAFLQYSQVIRDANAAITRMAAMLEKNGYRVETFILSQSDARGYDIIAAGNGDSAYSEYEQSIGGSVKGYK